MNKNRQGFTLIELLVVVLIIGILASVAIPQYFKVVERSRLSAPNSVFGGIASAEESQLVRLGSYTNDFAKLDQDYTSTVVDPVTGAQTLGAKCTGASCDMGFYNYTIVLDGDTGFHIDAKRVAPLATRYGDYTLTYTVPGNAISCTGGEGTRCQDELM